MKLHNYDPRSPQVRVLVAVAHEKKHVDFTAPCGYGKGVLNKFVHKVTGKASVIITSTVALNESYSADCADVRGCRVGCLRGGVRATTLMRDFYDGKYDILNVIPEYFGDANVISVLRKMVTEDRISVITFDEGDEST